MKGMGYILFLGAAAWFAGIASGITGLENLGAFLLGVYTVIWIERG